MSFATPRDAQNAITMLNDTDLSGRPIFVREDREAGNATTFTVQAEVAASAAAAAAAAAAVRRCTWATSLGMMELMQDLKDHFKTVRQRPARGRDGHAGRPLQGLRAGGVCDGAGANNAIRC